MDCIIQEEYLKCICVCALMQSSSFISLCIIEALAMFALESFIYNLFAVLFPFSPNSMDE